MFHASEAAPMAFIFALFAIALVVASGIASGFGF